MNFSEKELEVLKMWDEKNIFKKTLEKPSPKGPFVFYEGPPTANGKPGIHHAESRAFKDCIPRYKTMRGHKVVRKAGWDTHGLPVEIEVEKKLGFKSKAEIEDFGIAKFNAMCKESVWTYKKDWEEFTRRLGYWLDMDDPYITYEPSYIESLWWVVKQVWEKELLYEDYRVTPHCPRCGTSLSSHELSQGYKDVKDLTITAEFVVTEGSHESLQSNVKTSLLAWTTTPWTLPGNVALAVGPGITYSVIEKDDEGGEGRVRFVVAKALLEKLFEGSNYDVIVELQGTELVGTKYEPLYPFLIDLVEGENKQKLDEKAYRVHPADFVTTQDGTGIVHTAVMYGADDFVLGNEIGLPKQHIVGLDGKFVEEAGFLANRLVVDDQVAIDIIKDLAHRGLLFSKAKYEHSYPHCWRCKTKVIYYAKDSWYIRMSSMRDTLLAENDKINWEPAHIKEGRFGEWLREVKDWAFSRERYWGTPLPIWVCEVDSNHKTCIGSFNELKNLSVDQKIKDQIDENNFDPHRPFVDDVHLNCEAEGCDGVMERVKDVCDVWFDSGAMPYAQWHYPFENKELVDSGDAFPADYISEAIDQTRGWFYTLLAVSTLLGKERPYKNVISLGHVLDSKGKKMSKSVGNIVEPMKMIDTYGSDAVRWYMYSINQPGESKRFDEKTLLDMVRKNFGITVNVLSFYEMFAKDSVVEKVDSTHVLDRWILSRLNLLVQQTTDRLERYVVTETVREISSFINDLSTWYVRRSRDRFKGDDGQDRAAALSTLQDVLLTLSKLMAPFAPFFSEQMYTRAGGSKESVHLEDWPEVNDQLIDQEVLDTMGRVRSIVSKALERRVDAGVNIRQVLGAMIVTLESGELAEEYQGLILDDVNVKQMNIKKGEYSVELDLVLTPELIREGTVREIVRRVNSMRKKQGLTLEDRISLYVHGGEEVLRAVDEHKDALMGGTLASAISTEGEPPEGHETFKANEFEITVGF
jgi:isoleucyl-tRNA synthetase